MKTTFSIGRFHEQVNIVAVAFGACVNNCPSMCNVRLNSQVSCRQASGRSAGRQLSHFWHFHRSAFQPSDVMTQTLHVFFRQRGTRTNISGVLSSLERKIMSKYVIKHNPDAM